MNLSESTKGNVSDLKNKIERILTGGSKNLVCIFDFDKTLTYPMWGGQNVSTTFSQLRDLGLIDESYTQESKKLFEQYHPIEISETIFIEEKKQKNAGVVDKTSGVIS